MPRFCVAKICGMVPHLKLKNLTTGCPKKSVKEKLGEEFVFELKNFKKISQNWVLANWVSRKKAGNTFPKEQEQYTINWFLDGCDKPWGHDDQNCNCQ